MTLVELARKLRPYIEKAAASLSDEDAQKLHNLLYLLLRSIEDNYGL